MSILTRRELAEFTGFHEGTLSKWAKVGMPVDRDGETGSEWRCDSAKVVAWLLERERARHTDCADVSEQRARLLKAQAQNAEMDVLEREGELVPLSELQPFWSKLIFAFRARSLLVPGMAAPLVVGKSLPEVEDIIHKFVYEALTELAEGWEPATGGEPQ